MKITTFLIALTLTVSAVNTINYAGCDIVERGGRCGECFKRKVAPNGKGCLGPQPDSDQCLIYSQSTLRPGTYCTTCKTGYAIKPSLNSDGGTCVRGSIRGCIQQTNFPFRAPFCNACPNNTYPVGRGSSCVQVRNPLDNCKWGSAITGTQQLRCFLCNPGYSSFYKSGACVRAPQTGCQVSDETSCLACDPYDGYSMNANGKCYKP